MNRILAFVVGAVVVAVIIRASTFVVDQRQNAIVFQLGQITRVITEPGSRIVAMSFCEPRSCRLQLSS